MAREVFLVLCALISISTSRVTQPYDLVQEAEEQLQELTTLVQERISLADDDIQDLYNDFRQYAKDEIDDASISIQQEYQEINSQISQIETIAEQANKDVSSCINTRVDTIQQLSTTHNDEISACIDDVLAGGLVDTRESKYFVDIIMNKVHNMENQLTSCKGDLLCISPLVTQIQLYQISLIQDIRTEVAAVDGLLATQKLSSKTCGNQGVSEFITQSTTILRELTNCVNDILG